MKTIYILSILFIISVVSIPSIDGEIDCTNISIEKIQTAEWDYTAILSVIPTCEIQPIYTTLELIDSEFDVVIDTRLIGENEVNSEYELFVDIPYCVNITEHFVDYKFTTQRCFIIDTEWDTTI